MIPNNSKTYSLDVTQLLPLKAFYLGFALKDNINLPKVREMVDEALEKCGEKEDFQTRKVFYLLLKCELNRDTDNVSENREIAKNFCEEEDFKGFFENYIKIINKTSSRKTIVGGGAMSHVRQESISDHAIHFGEDEFGGMHSQRIDYALESLGLSIENCSNKDLNFLHKVTLKDILDKHFGES